METKQEIDNEKEELGRDLTFEEVMKMRAQYPQWDELFDICAYIETDERFTRNSIYENLFESR
jgi:hypothetical protein